MSSISSQLLGHVNAFRNPAHDSVIINISKIACTEAAYFAIIPFSLIEAVIAQAVNISARYIPVDLEPRHYDYIQTYGSSSANSILWAVHCFAVNLFSHDLIFPTERAFNRFYRHSVNSSLEFIQQYTGDLNGILAEVVAQANQYCNYIGAGLYNLINAGVVGADFLNPFSTNGAGRFDPPKVTPEVAKILQNYTLGGNATAVSDFLEKLLQTIEIPHSIDQIGRELDQIFFGPDKNDVLKFMQHMKNDIHKVKKDPSTKEKQALADKTNILKMMVSLHQVCSRLSVKDPDQATQREMIKVGFQSALEGCYTRKYDEFERFFVANVASCISSEYTDSLSPKQRLIYDLMIMRRGLRDVLLQLFNITDAHSYAEACKRLSNVFYLSDSSIGHDPYGGGFSEGEYDGTIIAAFQRMYTIEAIFVYFQRMVYRQTGDHYRFKNEAFLTWANEEYVKIRKKSADEGEDFDPIWADDSYTRMRPEVLIAYLEHLGVFQRIKTTD